MDIMTYPFLHLYFLQSVTLTWRPRELTEVEAVRASLHIAVQKCGNSLFQERSTVYKFQRRIILKWILRKGVMKWQYGYEHEQVYSEKSVFNSKI
jgi:hypothetical protein